jgi:hypothetical protein
MISSTFIGADASYDPLVLLGWGGLFSDAEDNHKNFSHVNTKSNKIIDSAVSLRYMSHASKVKIAVMSLLTAAM